jgi:hypothetical protein
VTFVRPFTGTNRLFYQLSVHFPLKFDLFSCLYGMGTCFPRDAGYGVNTTPNGLNALEHHLPPVSNYENGYYLLSL